MHGLQWARPPHGMKLVIILATSTQASSGNKIVVFRFTLSSASSIKYIYGNYKAYTQYINYENVYPKILMLNVPTKKPAGR
jgi:hypothetical protein